MEISLSAAHRLSRRTSRGNELLQEPAGAMGEGPRPDRNQVASANPVEQAAMENQNRGVFSSDGEHFISADDRAVVSASSGDDRPIQSGLVPNAVHRPAPVARIDGLCFHFLPDLPKRALSRLASAAEIPAVLDVCWNRSIGQQLEGGYGSAAWNQEQLQENAQISY